MTLDQIWDQDWFIIQAIVQEKEKYKMQKAEEAERISKLLGDSDKMKKRL
jgi:hypothetical protein